jgi:ferredoxin-NADP reductase
VKVLVTDSDVIGGDVKILTLAPVDQDELPAWSPGAHVDLHLENDLVRQYSLCSDPRDVQHWSVAVRRDAQSRGGSRWVHDVDLVGVVLECSSPRNNFELVDAPAYLFLAGGIGVTPFVSMCHEATRRAHDVRLAFGGPRDLLAGFVEKFSGIAGLQIELFDALVGPVPLDLLIAGCKPGTAVYCCGPSGMIDATRELVRARPDLSLYVEAFSSIAVDGEREDRPITIELTASGIEIEVPADQSILDAVAAQHVFVPSSCREGTCGTCEVAVLEGRPDHRDALIDREDPDSDLTMMICVSRAVTDRLVLDL